jgi:hypothetical protein
MGEVGTFFNNVFLWRFCAFLNKRSSKTPQKLFGENPCQKLLTFGRKS